MPYSLPTPIAVPATRSLSVHAAPPLRSLAHVLCGAVFHRVLRWVMVCAGLAIALNAAAEPAIYLLGEVHDNPEGHALRFERIAHIVNTAPLPVIAMEQFDRDKQALLDTAMRDCSDAACVIERAGGSGWDWPLYAPVIDLALRQHVPLVAANVSAQEARDVVRKGLAAALDATVLTAFYGRRGAWLFVPAALVALSRVATGSHWPSDIAASAIGSVLITAVLLALYAWTWRKFAPRIAPQLAAQYPELIARA